MITISSYLSGRISARRGPRFAMAGGLTLGGAGLLGLCLVGATTPYLAVAFPLAAAGFGMSFAVPAVTAAMLEAAPPEHAGIASGVLNAGRQLGGVLGVALLGALVGQRDSFMSGMHLAAALAGTAFLLGLALTGAFVAPHRRASDQESRAA